MSRGRPVKRLANPSGGSPGFSVVEVSWWRLPFYAWLEHATLGEVLKAYRIKDRAKRLERDNG